MQTSFSFWLCSCLSLVLLGLTTAVPQWHIHRENGRRYLIEGAKNYNWFQAFRECARQNLQLVEIDSREKNEAVITVLKSVFGNQYNLWIGANDEYNRAIDVKRPFYWWTSGRKMTFSNWSGKNPDNSQGNEHCVVTADPGYKWNDIACDTTRFGYICEDRPLREGFWGNQTYT